MRAAERHRNDFARRDPETLARVFRHFGEVECPQVGGRLYGALCAEIADDAELLALAARTSPTQPPPNMLFASAHYLLLADGAHPLAEWYPALASEAPRSPESAFTPFRAFCLEHAEVITPLLETRLTQTNVIQRCSALLPGFAHVSRQNGATPLTLVEIGPSAGLNLQWDRFRYEYDPGGVAWGDPDSPVTVPCELRGTTLPALPELPARIPVAGRSGIDLNPVDVSDPDAVRWLRALIWPEHLERHARLEAAIGIARRDPPTLHRGSAADLLPELLRSAPADTALCVYGTHTLYQFPPDALRATLKAMQAESRERPVDFLTMEGTGDRCSELRRVAYRDGERQTTTLANASPHGRWLEWLT
ncbi:MAG: DUF2332 domain-containing protein [Myxococcota bacterium]|nr:DUF2332 domain-containing protein [Myxococcota bacterium]